MQISEILAYLKNYNPRVLSANTDNGLLTKAETFTIDTDFKPEILYIGYESQVKDILRFLNGNTLFLLHDIEKTSIKNDYNNNIVFFPEMVNIDELLETCQRILSDQKKFYQQVYELTEAFLSLKPMQKIIDLIAQQIHNPVLMLDNSYRVLYTSQNIQCNDLQWNENVERGYCTYEFISKFYQMQTIPAENQPLMTGCFSSTRRHCITRLWIDDRQIGYLLSIESEKPFCMTDMQFIKTACRMISRFLLNDNRNGSDFRFKDAENALIEFLEGNITSRSMLMECLRYSELDLDSEYYLLLVNVKNYNVSNDRFENIKDYFSQLQIKYISVYYKEDIVVLLQSRISASDIMEKLKKNENMKEWNTTFVFSDRFSDLYQIPFYYNQAEHARDIASKMLKNQQVVSYDSVRLLDMLLSKPTKSDYANYIGSEYMQIYQYDKDHETCYFDTVYQYILNDRSLNHTADSMFIHKNTVSYRINKARELFSLDLDNLQTCMNIIAAYLLIQLNESSLLEK
jgi:sugar diacid utilization regulator